MISLLLTVLFTFTSHAQEAESEDTTLEPIVVRATKENKTYFKSPESVSVLKAKEIPATGRENNLEVLKAIPNVDVNKNGDSFSIRGINNTGVTGFQKDNLATLYIDELFQTELALQAGSFDLWDIDSIEILRGAQSTTQGVNALAGSVFLHHASPDDETGGRAKLAYGNFNHREIGAANNIAIIDDTLFLRLSYNKELDDGYITNITTNNDQWGKWDRDRARLSAVYKINDSHSLKLDTKFHRNKQGGTYVQSSDPFRYEVREDVDFLGTTTNAQIAGTYEYVIAENMRNIFIAGYSGSKQDSVSDADGIDQNTAGARFENHKDHFASLENRFYYQTSSLENLFGIHAHNFKLVDDYDFNLLYPVGAGSTPIDTYQGVDRSRQVMALFDSATYKWNDRHSLLFGIRGEAISTEYGTSVYGQRIQNISPGVNAAIDNYLAQVSGNYSGKNSDFVTLPKLGYTFNEGRHHSGITYTRGYRTAGVSINRRRATAVEYDAEFTDNYEIHYKYDGDSYRIGTNVFYIDWQDQQVQVQLSSDPFDTQVRNAASSEVYGAEVEARLRPHPKHDFQLGVGHTNTRFKDFVSGTTNYKDNEFPFAAHWTGRLGHEYKITNALTLFSVLRYVDPSYSNAENTRSVDDQFYANMNVRYELEHWTLEGYVYNIFDGRFVLFNGAPASTTSPYQGSYHQTSSPRQFGLRVTYNW